jgi:hyperosmotically inducible protein
VITTKIKAELAEEKLSSLVRINVDTDNKGMVVLSGNAANQLAIDRAVKIAHGVKGVTSVQNDIKIKTEK